MRDLETMLKAMKNKNCPKNIQPDVLSQEEMQRIFARASAKIEEERKMVSFEEEKSKRRGFFHRNLAKIAVAAVAVVVLGGTAGASMLHMNNNFKKYFGVEEKDKKIVANNMQALDVSTKQGDVTISGKQIIGDDTGFYAVFQMKNVPQYAGQLDFRETIAEIAGESGITWRNIMMGEDEGSVDFLLHVMTKDVVGKQIKISFQDIGYTDENGDFHTLAKGNWTLQWKLNYSNNTKTIHVNKDIDYLNGKAVWNNVKISPISVSVKYQIDKKHPISRDFTQREWEKYDGQNRIVVEYKDGTRLDSRFSDDDEISEDNDSATVCFHKIVDYSNIASISFCGQKLVLLNDYKEPKKTQYTSKAGNFTLNLPQELDGIITMKENAKYKDPDVQTTGTEVIFWGEKGGSKMALFSLYRLKGMYSPSDLEEKSPMMQYIGFRHGYTYTIRYGEIADESQNKNFADIMNKYVQNVLPFFEYLK